MSDREIVTGPGPYETRDGGTFHCAYVSHSGWAKGYINGRPWQVLAETGKASLSAIPMPSDVIRKRSSP